MRKLSKIFGVALIATSMLVSVTGCSMDYTAKIAELEAELSAKSDELIKADIKPVINVCGKKATITCNNDTYTNLIGTSVIVTYKIGEGTSTDYTNAFLVDFNDEITATATFNNITSETTVTVSKSDYVAELEATIAALRVTLQEKTVEAKNLLAEVNDEKAKNKSAEEIKTKYENKLAELTAERDNLATKVNTAETELASAKTELEALNAKIAELELAINGITIYLEVYMSTGKKASDFFQNALESKTINVPNGTKGNYLLDMFKVDGDNGCFVMNKYTSEVTFYEAKPKLDQVYYLDIDSLVVKESDIEISNGTSLSNSMTIKIMLASPSGN